MEDKIGAGAFGTVHVATRLRSGQQVAVKKVRAGENVTEEDVRLEADIMRRLDFPHVVQLLDYFWMDSQRGGRSEVWLVESYAEGGDLPCWVRARKRPLRESDHQRLALMLLRGLAYLHSHGILHRDIKPRNLLMSSGALDATLMIGDFGLCRRLRKRTDGGGEGTDDASGTAAQGSHGGEAATDAAKADEATAVGTGHAAPPTRRRSRAERVSKGFVGTAGWMAPEVLVCACEGAQGYSFAAE
jgi:serine/threonine protein kinase